MKRTKRVWGVWATLVGTALGGCAGPRTAGDALPEARPADLVLGLTVYGPDSGVRRGGQRPARYLVEPDGSLRAAVGGGAVESVHPPIARRLTDAERDELWAMVRAAGINRVSASMRLNSAQHYTAPAGRRVYLVELAGGGGRWVAAMPEGEPDAERAGDIADRLAGWAWVVP